MHHLPTAVAADFAWAADYWPDLLDACLPGTPRPPRPHLMTAEARALRDQLARIERAERAAGMPGEHPVPVDLDVVMALDELTIEAWTSAALTSRAIMCPIPFPPATLQADASPLLDFTARHLVEADFVDPGLAEDLAPRIRRITNALAHHLDLWHDGQILRITCPWCPPDGPQAAGDDLWTWRVRIMPGEQIAIVCEGVCEPPHRDVSTWWGGRPCWPLRDWAWLAKRLQSFASDGKIAS
ncbi:hypothetical protein [Streptosporangium sp. NPDC049078]|uniref:hypothetical protein n=1 Tax=Streptosporangium sp. NPDC049078 TaxID=3155767 RepID=UPI0034479805